MFEICSSLFFLVQVDEKAFKELNSLRYLTINDTLVNKLNANIFMFMPNTLKGNNCSELI